MWPMLTLGLAGLMLVASLFAGPGWRVALFLGCVVFLVTAVITYFSWSTLWWTSLAGLTILATWFVANTAKQHQQSQQSTQADEGPEGGSSSTGTGGRAEPEEEDQEQSMPDGVRLKILKIEGATGEIVRILRCHDFYTVLDVPREAVNADIKKAYRLKQLATHPDKNQGAAGALEASQRVNMANDALSDEVKRKQYDVRLIDEEEYGVRSSQRRATSFTDAAAAQMFDELVRESMPPPTAGAFYPTLNPSEYDPWGDAPDHTFRMRCACGYDHKAVKVPRESRTARLCHCNKCGYLGTRLPAHDCDVWFETSNSFMRQINPEAYIKAYRCVGRFVYDITEWSKCNGMLMDANGNPAPTNVHYVPFRLTGDKSKPKEKTDSSYGYSQFKGKGNNSHKSNNKKKSRARRG